MCSFILLQEEKSIYLSYTGVSMSNLHNNRE